MIVFLFLVFTSSSATRAQSCGDLCVHTPSGGLYTQAIYIAQAFQVTQPSRITAFTVQLQSPRISSPSPSPLRLPHFSPLVHVVHHASWVGQLWGGLLGR